MRFAVVAVVCLSMVVFATANDVTVGKRQEGDSATSNDVTVGERQEGDFLFSWKRLLRSAVSGQPMEAQARFDGGSEITFISAVNAPGSNATVAIHLTSSPSGESDILVTAISEAGAGLDVLISIYAIEPFGQPKGPTSS